ncbi:MAG: hypothetical protein V3V08_16680 [Nannocystaceae bacterium]
MWNRTNEIVLSLVFMGTGCGVGWESAAPDHAVDSDDESATGSGTASPSGGSPVPTFSGTGDGTPNDGECTGLNKAMCAEHDLCVRSSARALVLKPDNVYCVEEPSYMGCVSGDCDDSEGEVTHCSPAGEYFVTSGYCVLDGWEECSSPLPDDERPEPCN